MKKRQLLYWMMAFSISLFVGCSDDDNNDDDDDVVDYKKLEGEFDGTGLTLQYSDALMLGGKASYLHGEDENGTITLYNVIPGEATTTLNVTLAPVSDTDDTKFTFESENNTSAREIKYNGTIEEGKMVLNLDITLADNPLMDTWDYKSAHIYFESDLDPESDEYEALEETFNGLAEMLEDDYNIANFLQSVTFLNDGNIVASYSSIDDMEDPQFVNSPLNMVHYAVNGDKIITYLNFEMIMAGTPRSESEGGIMELLENLIAMTKNGIPVNFSIEGEEQLKVYLDKEFLSGIFSTDVITMVIGLVNQMIEEKLGEPDAIDIETTIEMLSHITKLEIGLNMELAADEAKIEEAA